ncbi:MAG: lysine-sensitive aspartokinase 3 [Bacteroidetes bacterium]|nr:lysine-sensitive aspartokinase 3 [Bacteroidota bacterium]
MIVMKFGGTSVEDAKAIKNLTEIVRKELPRRPIVIVSACSGITNQLLLAATLASQGKKEEALNTVAAIEARHKRIAKELFEGDILRFLNKHLTSVGEELTALVNGVIVLGELTHRSLDTFAAYGERISSLIIHHYFEQQRLKSFWVDARSFMITDDQYTKAVPQFEVTERKLREIVQPKVNNGYVVISQGFIGSTPSGVTTSIGRGGSDYSAAIIGALLDAEDIQIWTDVDGILSSDPTVVKDARKIKVMSFNEAAELAYFGARVLHPETILPAVKKNIPVRVLNSKNPGSSGTLIVSKPKTDKRCIVKSIAYKEGITLVSIVSTRMFLATGFLENIFDVFHKYQTVVHTVATSEVSVTATIDNTKHLAQIVRELKAFATVTVTDRKAIVCIVGDNLRNSPGLAVRMLAPISDVNINMISQGASEINLSFVIDEDSVDDVVLRLHAELFANAGNFPEIFE